MEKWEADHSTRKMNWATANHNRKTEFEQQSVFSTSDALAETIPMSRKELDTSNQITPDAFSANQVLFTYLGTVENML